MTKDEALKLALEALEKHAELGLLAGATITAVKEALAQPEQEPVAWGMMNDDGKIYDCICPEEHDRVEGEYTVPLYTVPPHRKPLTDEEIKRMAAKWFLSMYWPLCNTFARAIEAKLKEKNT